MKNAQLQKYGPVFFQQKLAKRWKCHKPKIVTILVLIGDGDPKFINGWIYIEIRQILRISFFRVKAENNKILPTFSCQWIHPFQSVPSGTDWKQWIHT